MFRQPYMCMSQHFPLPMFDTYIFLFVCSICVIPQVAKLLEFLLQVWEGLHVCVLEGACSCRSRVLLSEWRVRFGSGMLVPLLSVAAGCRCKLLLEGAAVRAMRALWSMLLPLQGAAVRVVCALWSRHAGAAAGCHCRVLLSAVCALWGAPLHSGVCALEQACWCCCRFRYRAAARCCLRVLCCQSGACALERACWCRCRVLLSQ